MTPIADDYDAICAALAAMEGAKRPDAAPVPSPQPGELCDDEITEAYLLWCGGG